MGHDGVALFGRRLAYTMFLQSEVERFSLLAGAQDRGHTELFETLEEVCACHRCGDGGGVTG